MAKLRLPPDHILDEHIIKIKEVMEGVHNINIELKNIALARETVKRILNETKSIDKQIRAWTIRRDNLIAMSTTPARERENEPKIKAIEMQLNYLRRLLAEKDANLNRAVAVYLFNDHVLEFGKRGIKSVAS